jgi:glyoxylase-like metal-dependent hydrolase (beta-lactamase superfamily II)
LNVGVATYVIHRGDAALVYDTYPTTQEAQWVRDYLQKAGIKRFTVANSHWHLDHVGGNAVWADVDRISTQRAIQLLTVKKPLQVIDLSRRLTGERRRLRAVAVRARNRKTDNDAPRDSGAEESVREVNI